MSVSLKKYIPILRDSKKTKFCNWQKVAIFFIMLFSTFVMLFFLVPVDDIARKIIPDFDPENVTSTSDSGPTTPSSPPTAITVSTEETSTSEGSSPPPTPPFKPSIPDTLLENSTNGISLDNIIDVIEGTSANETTTTETESFTTEGRLCNGIISNCGLRLNEVMYASLHNAMDTKEGGSVYVHNHLQSLEKAVDAGFRGMTLDVCECRGGLQFCHGACNTAFRDPKDVFQNLNDFLNDNKSEILILIFEMSVGSIKLEDFYDVMKSVDGFTDKIYDHKSPNDLWPTMSHILDKKKQIVMFEYGNKEKECESTDCEKHIHKYLDHSVETPDNFKDENEIKNYLQSCAYDKGSAGSKAFYNINNYVIPAKQEVSTELNSYASLKTRLTTCTAVNRNIPNLISVDYWSIGDVLQVVEEANKQIAAVMGGSNPGGLRKR